MGGAPGPDSASVSQVIPFSIPHIKYAVKHLFEGGLFADGGATLLEKLYVCQDSDMGHGENRVGGGAGSNLCLRKGLQAWVGGVPLVNCVTLNGKSAVWAPSSSCMVPGWWWWKQKSFFGSDLLPWPASGMGVGWVREPVNG